MSEPLLLVTMNEPVLGSTINVDGGKYRIARVIRWTGTVARLEIEPIRTLDDLPYATNARALLLALVDEPEPLTQYFIGLKVNRLVTDDEMCALADEGLVSVWARWWKGQDPSGAPAYALTEHGAREIEAPGSTR